MKIYVTYLRDEAGHHRYFHSSIKEARSFLRAQIEHPDENCKPDVGEPDVNNIELLEISNNKTDLINWLNQNCENASNF